MYIIVYLLSFESLFQLYAYTCNMCNINMDYIGEF